MAQGSPFLDPGLTTRPGQLAIALLARDNFQPITLEKSAGAVDGYAEGATLNTRFGSFPHSTLLDVPWGSQVRASAVDTGSRGRKRKLVDTPEDEASTLDPEEVTEGAKKAVQASSGFIHVLRPTPELWTSSLPHRTQVVYTPDYSYVLHRIRARPGTRIIEAGAGSGSFTHASARAVYNGCPSQLGSRDGKVFSFEYHEPRYEKMKEEIAGHGLESLVQMTHRDVYQDGFIVDGESPRASAVFLDLPAPWEALHHLSRRRRAKSGDDDEDQSNWVSPLDPTRAIHICTFSPCIEQVTKTVEELRKQGWTDVDMVEICNKKVNTVREKVGLNFPNERGFNQSPADVDQALMRLRDINKKTEAFNRLQEARRNVAKDNDKMDVDDGEHAIKDSTDGPQSGSNNLDEEKPWLQGRIVHRTEAELKTHTSYLVFAILPPEWSEEDEARAMAKWPCGSEVRTIGSTDKAARKQEKRELLETKKKQKRRHYTQAQTLGQSSSK